MPRRLSYRRKSSTPQVFRSTVQLTSSIDPVAMSLITTEIPAEQTNIKPGLLSSASSSAIYPSSSSTAFPNSMDEQTSWSYRSMKRLSGVSMPTSSQHVEAMSGLRIRGINESWKQIVDNQQEILRIIFKYFLEPMRIESQLKSVKQEKVSTTKTTPTLDEEDLQYQPIRRKTAFHILQLTGTEPEKKDDPKKNKERSKSLTLIEMARYQKLFRLGSILEDIVDLENATIAWLVTQQLPRNVQSTVNETMKRIKGVTNSFKSRWITPTISLNAKECFEQPRALEWRITQLHVDVERLLNELVKLALCLKECKSESTDDKEGSNPTMEMKDCPLTQSTVANLEILLPTKFSNYNEVAKQMCCFSEDMEDPNLSVGL